MHGFSENQSYAKNVHAMVTIYLKLANIVHTKRNINICNIMDILRITLDVDTTSSFWYVTVTTLSNSYTVKLTFEDAIKLVKEIGDKYDSATNGKIY